jgi:transposase
VEGLLRDKSRPPGRKPLPQSVIDRVITLTGQAPPARRPIGALAPCQGGRDQHQLRAAHAHPLKPHQVRTFKLSKDPKFASKLRDIVGLYVDPPAHPLVLSVDEKSQIQAIDRSQPALPVKPGCAGTMTHDYTRHGTTTLFAALDVLEGKVIGQCTQHHRHQDFIRFLSALEQRIARRKAVHVVLDNYATHKHPAVLAWLAWLAKHPRWTFHFTPTSCSWLNAIETFSAKLTKRRLKRGIFRSVPELKIAIHAFIAETNDDPKPFVWTAEPHRIIAAVNRGLQKLESIH